MLHYNADFTKKKYGQFLLESMTAASNAAAILGSRFTTVIMRQDAVKLSCTRGH